MAKKSPVKKGAKLSSVKPLMTRGGPGPKGQG